MRKFIVKHFALSYELKIGKTHLTALRASRIIFPLFCLTGLLITYTGWHLGTYILSAATLYALFLGFIYFEIWPVKWEELDDSQKWQMGMEVQNNMTTSKLTPEQWEEWFELDEKFSDK